MTILDMDHMLHVQNLKVNEERQDAIAQKVSFNGHIDVCGGANSINMQNLFCHSQLPRLAIGN